VVSPLNNAGASATPSAASSLGSINNTLAQGKQMVPPQPQQQNPLQASSAAATGQQEPLKLVMQILQMVSSMIGTMAGGSSTPAAAGTAPASGGAAAAAASPAPAGAPAAAPAAAAPNGRLKVATIDNFSNGTHGAEMAGLIQNGGGDASLKGKVDVLQFDLAGKGTAGIAENLQKVLAQVKGGAQIDAVSISQQDFNAGGSTPEVKALIDQIQAAGVPVAIAAGNGGTNALGTTNSFNVMSQGADSGKGNVQGQGDTTSRATANLAPILAAKKAAGQNISQIHSALP
jgi:hypothetical protein